MAEIKGTPAVVIHTLPNGDVVVFGPFESGEQASRWGFETYKSSEGWYWEYMFKPKMKG